jgi:hypothetical protein
MGLWVFRGLKPTAKEQVSLCATRWQCKPSSLSDKFVRRGHIIESLELRFCKSIHLIISQTTANNRQRREAPFSYCKRLPQLAQGFRPMT